MSFGSWDQFFAMGGYALYVWGSYGVMAALLAGEVLLLRARRRNIEGQLALMARERRPRETGAA